MITRDDHESDNDANDNIANFFLFVDCDPISFDNAIINEKWVQAMKEEIHSIKKNNTWELTSLPPGKKAIDVKCVYKTKYKPDDEVDRYKARLVVKATSKNHGLITLKFLHLF